MALKGCFWFLKDVKYSANKCVSVYLCICMNQIMILCKTCGLELDQTACNFEQWLISSLAKSESDQSKKVDKKPTLVPFTARRRILLRIFFSFLNFKLYLKKTQIHISCPLVGRLKVDVMEIYYGAKTTSYRMSVAPWKCFKCFEYALKI